MDEAAKGESNTIFWEAVENMAKTIKGFTKQGELYEQNNKLHINGNSNNKHRLLYRTNLHQERADVSLIRMAQEVNMKFIYDIGAVITIFLVILMLVWEAAR